MYGNYSVAVHWCSFYNSASQREINRIASVGLYSPMIFYDLLCSRVLKLLTSFCESCANDFTTGYQQVLGSRTGDGNEHLPLYIKIFAI